MQTNVYRMLNISLLIDASKEAVWIRKFISGLGIVPTIEEPISMYCDNTGAIAITKDDESLKREEYGDEGASPNPMWLRHYTITTRHKPKLDISPPPFNAIYKHLTRKSGENDADLVENAKTSYLERCDNLEELFGPDPREHPAGKQRASKKQKSVDTSSAGGSTGGSQSESVSSLVSQDYRRKCDAAERAYEANRDKELAMMQCRELEFLMLDPSTLPPEKRAIIEKKQAEIMKKYPSA
ncbi:hypothetical protein Tco_1447883 [Tanacetum coccineum]